MGNAKSLFRLMILMVALWGTASPAAEPSHYRAGVKAYLEGNDESALSHLEMAVRNNDSPEKASLLLSKVKARLQKIPPAAAAPVADPTPQPRTAPSRVAPRKIRPLPVPTLPEREAVVFEPVRPVAPQPSSPPSLAPLPKKSLAFSEIDRRALIAIGGGLLFFTLLLMAAAFYAHLQKTQRKLLEQIETMQKAARVDAERIYLRAEEDRQRAAAEMKRLEDERKRQVEWEEKRKRDAERLARDSERRRAAEAVPLPMPPKTREALVQHQKDRIMEVLVDISPPERKEAWARIAQQVQELYRTSPESALSFLRKLASDDNVWTRASIVSALTAISSPAAIDILFELNEDGRPEIQREVLRGLKFLAETPPEALSEDSRERVRKSLTEEKEKGTWIV